VEKKLEIGHQFYPVDKSILFLQNKLVDFPKLLYFFFLWRVIENIVLVLQPSLDYGYFKIAIE
jgi:hypothetical protein